jgi:hypothetical protein
MVGNRFLSLLTGMLYNTTLTDMETGYKAFRSDVLRQLHLTEDSFGIEPEITGEICRRQLRVYEIPIAYYGRTYAEGKNITWRDGIRAVFVLVRTRIRPIAADIERRSPDAPRPFVEDHISHDNEAADRHHSDGGDVHHLR